MKKNQTSKNPKHLSFAVLAADTVLFAIRDKKLCVRLVSVNRPPYFVHAFGLPGGLLAPHETAEEAALRHLEEKGGVRRGSVYAEQLYTFSAVGRDPRGRVVAVAYLALAPWQQLSAKERTYTEEAFWCPVAKLPKLAYDHNEVVQLALERLRARIGYTTIVKKLLPKEFPLMELEQAYEVILEKRPDRRNFRKKIMKLKLVMPLGRKQSGQKWRPAMLYAFRSPKVVQIDIL